MSQTLPGNKSGLTLFLLSTTVAVYSLLEAMLAPALTVIQEGVGATTAEIAWVFTGLLLSAAVTTPVASRLGELYDKKYVLLCVLFVTTVGTFLSGVATTPTVLAGGQILQGVGLSLVPLSLGLIRETQPARREGFANGLVIGVSGASAAIGILLAGPIVERLPYQFLYYIPGTLLVVLMIAIAVTIPRSSVRAIKGRTDWMGAFLLGGGLTLLLIGVTRAASHGWTSGFVVSMAGIGLFIIVVFVIFERRTADPLLDVRIGSRTVAIAYTIAFTIGFATSTFLLTVPTIVGAPKESGYGLGESATVTGLILLPFGIMTAVSAPLSGKISKILGVRKALAVALGSVTLSSAAMLYSDGRAEMLLLAGGLVGVGAGLGLTQVMNIISANAPVERATTVMGMAFVIRSVGGAIGGQVVGSILASNSVPGLPVPAWGGFIGSFVLLGIFGLLAGFLVFAIPRTRSKVVGELTSHGTE
ncbi:MFS transporter (plasmid) [Rhodococcus qingshengii]|uniref:MFS transporter n=1 Tax=Rhodococcus qingshengii TaxID=334542 RepID=UPI002113748A|nr:MFS transporter [Rhodococcus qingshengii]UUE28629.1 MFS transporter [Rhodococcus qingshengii]